MVSNEQTENTVPFAPEEDVLMEDILVEDAPVDAAPAEEEAPSVEEVAEMPIVEEVAEPSLPEVVEETPVSPEADVVEDPGEVYHDESELRSMPEAITHDESLDRYRTSVAHEGEMADLSSFKAFRRTTKTEKNKSKPVKSDFDVFANRRKAKTLNAAVAAADPILYYYNACVSATGEVGLINVYQVLQDRFMGKLVPQLFTSVAEGSSKIEALNMAQLEEIVRQATQHPEYTYLITMSARFFTKPALLEKMFKALPDVLPSLAIAFDAVSLNNIGVAAKAGLDALRARGIKVVLDSTERVSMTGLTELPYDYIRVDSRYYELGNPMAEAYLGLLVQLAHQNGVKLIASFCDTVDMCEYMLYLGVDLLQGNAISRPMRTLPNALSALTLLPSMHT